MIHLLLCNAKSNFYPRSPCGERLCAFWMAPSRPLFLSTLSLRRATDKIMSVSSGLKNFYPRSPCGERPMMPLMGVILILFLSTLSLRRATSLAPKPKTKATEFLSTLSLRRATASNQKARQGQRISIHALLAESDDFKRLGLLGWLNFYPRSPCGERPSIAGRITSNGTFLSTLSLRRATMIHPHSCNVRLNFYPRSPCGERRPEKSK